MRLNPTTTTRVNRDAMLTAAAEKLMDSVVVPVRGGVPLSVAWITRA